MSLDPTDLESELLSEFDNAFEFKEGYQTVEEYRETVSESISQSVKKYIEALTDDDGDSVISPIVVTNLKSSIKDALSYDPDKPEDIDISRLDLSLQTNLISLLVGIQFGITRIPPGWLTKISSVSTVSTGQIIFYRRSIPDNLKVTNEEQAQVLANEIKELVANTVVLTIGTLPGSPPTPTSKSLTVK